MNCGMNNFNYKAYRNHLSYPYIVIDDWYNEQEEKAVWKELDYYSTLPKNYIKRAEDTAIARDNEGNPKGKSFRFYANQYYTETGSKISPIFNCLYKQKSKEFHSIVDHHTKPYNRMFLQSNVDNTLISYYEDGDFYDAHWDVFTWSMCIWFVREPRKFTGGDFVFNEINEKVELKHNRAVFFPSCYLHSVEKINMNEGIKDIGWGRYTITHFYTYVPSEFMK